MLYDSQGASAMSKAILLLVLAASWNCYGDDQVISPKPKTRVRLAGVSVGAGYSHFSGPYYGYPYSYWPGYYSPAWGLYPSMYYPMFHPGFYNGFAQGPQMGEVRLRTEALRAEVYLDGAYAGTAGDLKSMWLEPGAYSLEVKNAGGASFSRRIYVLSGKSLRINAGLLPAGTENKQ